MQAQSSYGFCAGNSPMAGSVGFGYEVSPTLRSGQSGTNMVPTVIYNVIVVNTGNTNANGSNVRTDGVAYTIDLANSNAVCYCAGDSSE